MHLKADHNNEELISNCFQQIRSAEFHLWVNAEFRLPDWVDSESSFFKLSIQGPCFTAFFRDLLESGIIAVIQKCIDSGREFKGKVRGVDIQSSRVADLTQLQKSALPIKFNFDRGGLPEIFSMGSGFEI